MQPRATLALLLALAACGRSHPAAVVHTARGPVDVRVEVASTPAARERGLMYRRALADGDGMLFVFDDATDHRFWMKDTLVPLDMIFIGDDRRIVGIHPDAVPLSLGPISVGSPSRWVLEVAGGYAARAGIAVGDHVEFRDVPPT